MDLLKLIFSVYLSLMAFMSLLTFLLYRKDKKRAIEGKERIKEKTLLLFSCYNGAIGSLIGRIVSHHKTDKKYFSIVIYFSLIIQLFTLCLLTYLTYFMK